MDGYYIHREPVLDRKKRVFGYELSFRKANGPDSAPVWPAVAVGRDVIEAVSDAGGFAELSGDGQTFLDIDPGAMEANILSPLPKNSILQIPEREGLDKDVVINSRTLKKESYDICVNYTPPGRGLLPLYQVADFVRIDAQSVSHDELESTIAPFTQLPLKLRATGVHDAGTFDRCLKCGFDLFQGTFYIQPTKEGAPSISASQGVLMQLSNDLRENRDIHLIEKAFRNSPKLTYGLLKLINSAFFGMGQKVSSIRQAIMLLGYENLQKWVIILLFTIDHDGDRPNPIVEKALVRSRVMEILARKTGEEAAADSAFITGMLSLITVLFQVTVDEIAQKMNLTQEIQDALLNREGFLGILLGVAEKMDRQEYEGMEEDMQSLKLRVEDVLTAETAAVIDSQSVLRDYQCAGRQ